MADRSYSSDRWYRIQGPHDDKCIHHYSRINLCLAVIVAKLDRLTRSVKDLCGLLELFEKRKVALISVAEALDTGSAAGRLVITINGRRQPMGA